MKIITTTADLEAFCKNAADAPFLALDTEFMRETTYYSILCLIQIAIPGDEAIIDPLADGIDLTPLFDLMCKPDVIKVLHASRQDYEIFYQICGQAPAPLFDTQIAAMALGYGENAGYGTIVKGELGIQLDKGARFTNWAKRPLSEKQLSYAIADVTHLRDLYPGMVAKLEEKNRLSWIEQEMQALLDENLYNFDPELSWRRLRPKSRKPEYLAVMKAAAAWRERQAKKRNIPKNRIFKDDVIYTLAERKPRSIKELQNLRGVPQGLSRQKGADRLVHYINEAIKNVDDYAPKLPKPVHLPQGLGPAVEMLKTLLRLKTENEGIAPRIVASNKDLDQIAAYGKDADVKTLSGWRYEVFGKYALDMRDGNLALRLDGTQVVVESRG